MTAPVVLDIPGLGDSTEGHWQTTWEAERSDCRRLELGAHEAPVREDWVALIDRAIADEAEPIVLTAHSLGCIAVAWWAAQASSAALAKLRGVLLVAPPDLERPDMPDAVESFAPTPRDTLPFPAILAASSDDPYCHLECARALAEAWGADFVDAGAVGHLNAASALGSWEAGQRLLERLIALKV